MSADRWTFKRPFLVLRTKRIGPSESGFIQGIVCILLTRDKFPTTAWILSFQRVLCVCHVLLLLCRSSSFGFVIRSRGQFVPVSRGIAVSVFCLMSSRRRTGKPRSEQVLWAPGAVSSASQLRAAGVLLPLQAKDACDQVDCPGDCARVFALRDKILEALVFELHTKLYPLLRAAWRASDTYSLTCPYGVSLQNPTQPSSHGF